MRDIREDLRHRLTRIGIQRSELQQRIAWLGQMQDHIKAALEYELLNAEGDQALLFSESIEIERSPLAQFIREALGDFRPRSLDDLKSLATARGVDFKDKNPGRVLHFALVGMAQSKLVESLGNGIWKLRQESSLPTNDSAAPEDAHLM